VFIPVVGQIWMLMMMLKPGEAYNNEYGTAPSDGFAGTHPYDEPNPEDTITYTEQPEITPVIKSKTPMIRKEKGNDAKKGFWIQDRGAVDFRKPSKRKRKT
jgi:hypothetical protein